MYHETQMATSPSTVVPNRRYFRTPATAPGPSGPQMLRVMRSINRDSLGFLASMNRRYGPVVQFPIPSPPTYLVSDPEAVRRVLVTRNRSYDKETLQYRALSLVTGEGLLSTSGERWRRQRSIVQPAFHRDSLDAVGRHAAQAVDDLVDRWGDLSRGAVIDMDEAMMRAALEVVGRSLLGTDFSRNADRLAQATLHALDVVVARARVPITPPDWLPTPANRRLRAAVSELDAAVEEMIVDRQAHPAGRVDMLQMLIGAMQGTDAIGVREVRDEIVSFMVAGHETVASALVWAWWLVAGAPDVQDALAAESDAVLAGAPACFDDVKRLPFARAVLDEAMRLYPPVWLVTRRALESDVLGGREIPRGALVIMTPYVVQRDPRYWDRPDDFDPGRFAERRGGGAEELATFWPFGLGPRMCLGRDFAYVEGILILSALARRVQVERLPGQVRPSPQAGVTLRPEGALPLVVRGR
ncbi:MAG: cytochrome P450 [Actinobacteria bacterium]|nr:cytochrome P450 [Actinomycetota bacterium]